MFVIPSVGPNSFAVPSGPVYNDNAVNAIYQGLATTGTPSVTFGTPGTPPYYVGLPNNAFVPVTNNIVTDFPSWLGNADPGTTFGPGYANELGNRLYFGFAVIRGAADPQISISQLSLFIDSNIPEITFTVGAGGYDYNARTWGVLFGPNGMLGGGDDTIITSGPNTQMVDAIIGRGTGLALSVLSSFPGATNQDRIDQFASTMPDYFMRGAYTLGPVTTSVVTNFFAVPEPGTVLGGLGALGCFVVLAQRRRQQK